MTGSNFFQFKGQKCWQVASFPGPKRRRRRKAWFQPFVHALNYLGVDQWEGANDAFKVTRLIV